MPLSETGGQPIEQCKLMMNVAYTNLLIQLECNLTTLPKIPKIVKGWGLLELWQQETIKSGKISPNMFLRLLETTLVSTKTQ